MKFAIAKEHYDRFHKEGFVEFEGLVKEQEVLLLHDEVLNLLRQNMALSDRGLLAQEPKNLYLKSRNLWQQSDAIKKIILHKRLASIAASLTDATFVRFGYDQFIPAGYESVAALSIEEASCLQGVLCGSLICLSAKAQTTEQEPINSPFSSTPGNIVFFKNDFPLDFTSGKINEGACYLMTVYAQKKAVYIHNDNDPNQHFFKSLGYVFGDKLNDVLNPVILRS